MIELVDMCSLQDPAHVDFKKMKDSGVRGVYLKSSQYSGSEDPTFDIGVERATAAGLVCGPYHFAYCGSDAATQMAFFWKASRGLGSKPGELPPLIDWEYAVNDSAGRPLSKLAVVEWLLKALQSAKTIWYPDSDRKPSAYTFPEFALEHAAELASQPLLGNYPLTLAAYPSLIVPRDPPKPWTAVTVHQYAGNDGRVPGVATACDRDRFMGTEEDFQAYIGNSADLTLPVQETSGGIIHPLPGDEV